MVFLSGQERKFSEFYANPPLAGYVLALPLKLFGEKEVPLHLSYTLFTVLAGFFMYKLAKRLGLSERLSCVASLLLLITPGVYVMGHTLMPDIQLLVFFLAAVSTFVEAEDKHEISHYLAAGLFAGLATLTRYSGLTLVVVFLVYTLLKNRKLKVPPIISMVVPIMVLMAWYGMATSLYGKNYWSTIIGLESPGNRVWIFIFHSLASITQLGGAAIFAPALFLLLPLFSSRIRSLLVRAAFIITLILAFILVSYLAHTPTQALQFVLIAFPILFFLGGLLSFVRLWFVSQPRHLFLAFWIYFLVLFNSSFLHAAVKYNILEIPPLIILFLVMLQEAKRASRPLLAGTAVLTGLLSVAAAVADYRYANVYRSFSEHVIAEFGAGKGNLYYGGDWGWDYYMNRAGLKPIISTGMPELKAGDTVIFPTIAYPQPLPKGVAHRSTVERQISIEDGYPVRTHNPWAKAFFYSDIIGSSIGVLPFSFSNVPLETFNVIKLK